MLLEAARLRGVPWLDVAAAFDVLGKEALPADLARTNVQLASALSGYSANHLRRMSMARRFVLELGSQSPELMQVLMALGFSHAEMLGKIWRIDQLAAREVLQREAPPRYIDLTKIFENLATKPRSSLSRRSQTQLRQACIRPLTEMMAVLLPGQAYSHMLIAPRVSPDCFCKPDLLLRATGADSGPIWSGIDFIVGDDRQGILTRKMITVATESTFLTSMWICVADAVKSVDLIEEHAKLLGLDNLGVLLLSGSQLHVCLYPQGEPRHDRRVLWQPPRLWHVLAGNQS